MGVWDPEIKGWDRRGRWGDKKALTCRNPYQAEIQPWEEPGECPGRAVAPRPFLAAVEWDQGVELAAWVPPAVRVHPVVWDRVEVWDQPVAVEAADDKVCHVVSASIKESARL